MIYFPDPANTHAVLVGVSEYADPGRWPPLPAVRRNVDHLREVLTDPSTGSVAAGNCVSLVDPRDSGDVLDAVDDAAAKALDTVIVYFAGHGHATESDLCLPTCETTSRNLRWRSVTFSAVRDVLRRRQAPRAIVLLDCCFSGMAHSMADTEAFMDNLIEQTSAYTLTSSARDSVSLAPPDEPYTAFTGQLLDVLRTGIPGMDRCLSLGDITRAVTRGLADRGLPLPRFSQSGAGDQLALVVNRSWVPTGDNVDPVPSHSDSGDPQPTLPDIPVVPEHVARAVPATSPDPAEVAALVEMVEQAQFSMARFKSGYDRIQVDDFFDEIVAAVQRPTPTMTPAEIRNKVFDVTRIRPGYDVGEVDVFLDKVEWALDKLIKS